MHELSLAADILEQVESACLHNRLQRVTGLELGIGALSCVDAQALETALELVLEGTVAARCKISIKIQSGTVICEHCGKQYSVTEYYSACPACERFGFRVISGREMLIERIIGS